MLKSEWNLTCVILFAGKYKITTDGSLLIEKADLSDGKKKYRCICRDEMDNESVSSEPWGQLIVTGKLVYLKKIPYNFNDYKFYFRYTVLV